VHGPMSPGWLMVALCSATGAYCLLRMRSSTGEQRRSAGAEALMGFGMAAMAVPASVLAPPLWAWAVYTAVFGAAALHALWASRRNPHHLHHLVGALAMVYTAVAMAAAPGHHGHGGGAGVPALTGALLLYFTGHVLLSGARLLPVPAVAAGPAGAGGGRAAGWGDRPELARACQVSMGIAMVIMLVTL
jgi:peptidoglycan/LPS O-acetylase OafA/YrhL